MVDPTVPHLKADLRVLNHTDHFGRFLTVHVGQHLRAYPNYP